MVDNVLWDGRVADSNSRDADTLAICDFNQRLHRDKRVAVSVVPIGDGLTLALKGGDHPTNWVGRSIPARHNSQIRQPKSRELTLFVGVERYPVDQLRLGMYVCELDRPWTDTPFLYQGFFLDTDEQIEEIRKHCVYVYVDEMRERQHVTGICSSPTALQTGKKGQTGTGGRDPKAKVETAEVYPVQQNVEEELEVARAARDETEEAFQVVLNDLKLGKKPALVTVRGAVNVMVESVIRNPNAMVWLTRLKKADSYTYAHSLDVSAFLMVFGRHLGLPRSDLAVLGMGGLLLDIGKTQLPLPLLNKRSQLNDAEYEELRSHVDKGIAIVHEMENVPKRAVEMVQQHHERFDGSGYPKGLEGKQIEVFARMAAIVDTFDAITSERPYANALSSHEALRKLYDWAGMLFHKGLVEQFIECLGIYPVGTLVELSTGEVGVVLAQNRFRQLKPRLILILDPDKNPYGTMDVLDLIENPVDEDGDSIEIARALEPGMYGVDPREYYI